MSTMEETLINVTTMTNVEEVIPLLRGEPKYWCVYTVMNRIVSAARSLTCRDDLDSKWRLLLAEN